MSHIFISYSRSDVGFVRYLKSQLEQRGFAVWIDEERIAPSTRWWRIIEENIDQCAAFIVVMSPEAYDSEWVEREILRAEARRCPIFPILLAGDSWSRLANIQFEDMRGGIGAPLSPQLLVNLRRLLPEAPAARPGIELRVEADNIATIEANVVVMKHAQGFHGADRIIAGLLEIEGVNITQFELPIRSYAYTSTQGAINAQHVLFVGVEHLRRFKYGEIRQFAADALQILATEAPETQHIAMTIHGPGAGLDEAEGLRAQIAGYLDALQAGNYPKDLERITIVEISERRVEHLRVTLMEDFSDAPYAEALETGWGYRLLVAPGGSIRDEDRSIEGAGRDSDLKPYAYVTLPPGDEMEDIFYFGIQRPAHTRGLLCERIEPEPMTPDVVEQVKQRISRARVVIVDLSDASADIYLQLGYAWGRNRPTIILMREGYMPSISLDNYERLVVYKRLKDIESAVTRELDMLRKAWS